MNPRCFVRIAGAGLIALIVYGCETLPKGPLPRATEVGWWHGEDASGPAKIVVHIGEQDAYFYKCKGCVGEATVSTGQPGFCAPSVQYTVVSKEIGNRSVAFGDD